MLLKFRKKSEELFMLRKGLKVEKASSRAAADLRAVRETKPLVHNITNFVVMNFTANALLAAGASPVMAHAENEVDEMVEIAQALVLNIGTLSDTWVKSMLTAGARASALGKPIVLDPVGAGATSLRTNSALLILARSNVTVVRGNASEILALADRVSGTKGVESAVPVQAATEQARRFAAEKKTTVALTGPVDTVTDGSRIARVANGHKLMAMVTGTGCVATALIGAFCAVDADPFCATTAALAYFGLAGESAASRTQKPGSFALELLNALYTISPEELEAGAKIEIVGTP